MNRSKDASRLIATFKNAYSWLSGGLRVKNAEGNTFIGKALARSRRTVVDFRRGKDNTLVLSQGCVLEDLQIIFKGDGCRVELGANVRWSGRILIAGNKRTIRIGENTTARSAYLLSAGADILIGRHCMLSREIEIRTTDAHKIYSLDDGRMLNQPSDVIIGDRVWIAARAIVNKGSRIPSGCVVGAASFVNRAFDVGNVVIAGIPAVVVKEGVRWER